MKEILELCSVQKMDQINDIHDSFFGISDQEFYRIVLIDQKSFQLKALDEKIYSQKEKAIQAVPRTLFYMDYEDMISQLLRLQETQGKNYD